MAYVRVAEGDEEEEGGGGGAVVADVEILGDLITALGTGIALVSNMFPLSSAGLMGPGNISLSKLFVDVDGEFMSVLIFDDNICRILLFKLSTRFRDANCINDLICSFPFDIVVVALIL